MDKSLTTNVAECQRYFCKSYDYAVKPGTVSANGKIYSYWLASSHPYTGVRYPCTMAKAPTISGYSPDTGAITNVRDNNASADKAIISVNSAGDGGFSGFGITSPNAANWQGGFHYTADTGW
jgi:hypothetical protein